MSKLSPYCWDANIFVAWLGNEPEHLAAISQMVDDVDCGRSVLVLPAIIHCEILDCHRDRKSMHDFTNFLRRSNVIVHDVNEAMALKACDLRNRGKEARPARDIKTPDALYVATAILTKAKALYTTDSRMLALDGSDIVERLPIKLPKADGLF